jgi:hypothetical protein
MLGGGLDHAPQQLAVADLELALLPERDARAGNAVREGVSHALELFEAGKPRTRRHSGDAGIDFDPRERLGREPRELALEAADLAAQLGASEALVAADSKRNRLSFEQFRHRSRV